jgi:hypothetical protein
LPSVPSPPLLSAALPLRVTVLTSGLPGGGQANWEQGRRRTHASSLSRRPPGSRAVAGLMPPP